MLTDTEKAALAEMLRERSTSDWAGRDHVAMMTQGRNARTQRTLDKGAGWLEMTWQRELAKVYVGEDGAMYFRSDSLRYRGF